MQAPGQGLTRRHAFSDAGFFGGVIQLNDRNFLLTGVDEGHGLNAQFWMMPNCGLQIKIGQINRREH